jgi:SAM-dependent methyltransferase
MPEPETIFSSRVDNYLKYRPGYPAALLDLLRMECSLSSAALVADIGAGTGLLSELFLKNGNLVHGIEPNPEMRGACENRLKGYPRFISVAARAEATTLRDQEVDFIAAGQAFHWFEPGRTKKEFVRILRPDGWIVVVYNLARIDTPFLAAYHQFSIAYLGDKASEAEDPDIFTPFFGSGNFTEKRLEGECQCFGLEGLAGRVLSRATAPEAGSNRYDEMMEALRTIFDRYQQAGEVGISYDTQVVYGRLPWHK